MKENETNNEDQNLEKDVSPASESVIAEDVAVAKFTALRSRAQTAETEAARLQGVIEGMEKANAKAAPAVVSPLDAEIAKQAEEGIAESDMTITPAIYRKQQKHEAQVRNLETQAQAKVNAEATKEASRVAARALHPDWDAVINDNQQHLTSGEQLDIEQAGDFGAEAYKKCLAVSERLKIKPENIVPEKLGKPEEEVVTKKVVLSQDEILSVVGSIDPATEAVANM